MKTQLSLEETEALLYGQRVGNAFIHNGRVFQIYEPGTQLESQDQEQS